MDRIKMRVENNENGFSLRFSSMLLINFNFQVCHCYGYVKFEFNEILYYCIYLRKTILNGDRPSANITKSISSYQSARIFYIIFILR